jgi:hypothetical protein
MRSCCVSPSADMLGQHSEDILPAAERYKIAASV